MEQSIDSFYEGEIVMNNNSIVLNVVSWMFGIVFFAIGIINTFWGNDSGFGVFIILLSLVYFLPVNDILVKVIGCSIPGMEIVKIVLGIFIFWAALGVGELFDKINLIMTDSAGESQSAERESREKMIIRGASFGSLSKHQQKLLKKI
jgi:hypothetical protein